MTDVLFIKHFSDKLNKHEKQDLLKHYGAVKTWFITNNNDRMFAQFSSIAAAEIALRRLHQLEIFGKRLTVEYVKNNKDTPIEPEPEMKSTDALQEFVDQLNSWNPSVGFLQPPPPHLLYKYPTATPGILFNIVFSLSRNKSFYIQTLHLMNKMCLDPPFGEINEETKTYLIECLEYLDLKIPQTIENGHQNPVNSETTSEESEISSEETDHNDMQPCLPIKRKSKNIINPQPLKKMYVVPKASSSSTKSKLKTEDVFEGLSLQGNVKKINVNVQSWQLPPKRTEGEDVVAEQMCVDTNAPLQPSEMEQNKISEPITLEHILENKISTEDMKVLPVYKSYQRGAPSTKLYIKNLSKDVQVLDLEKVYQTYIVGCSSTEKELFNIRLMQEGRMKGQAFVNFPRVELCERALNETNGFILKSKPMVVQFAKTTK